jgi:hypothetical protein
MTDLDLTTREAQDIIDGDPLHGRADLGEVVALAVFMRATGEVEPAPPMSPDLIIRIDRSTVRRN